MTREELDVVVAIARSQAGLSLTGAAAAFAESRLAAVARRENLASVSLLIDKLRLSADPMLAAQAAEALADQNTCFFRDSAVFGRIRDEILPAIAARKNGAPILVWSAGCSTGQEPYSLAMLVSDLGGAVGGSPLKIVASDLSERALHKARSGFYSHFEVQRGLPIRSLLRHFDKADEHWRIAPEIRQAVRWGKVNLMDDLARFGPFDMILCRNVLSAMEPVASQCVLSELDAALSPSGWLVLGADEKVTPPMAFAGADGLYARNPAYGREAGLIRFQATVSDA